MMLVYGQSPSGPWTCAACGGAIETLASGAFRPCPVCKGRSIVATTSRYSGGPGTELKKLLAKIGIVATPTCRCNSRAAVMDENERKTPGWCEENIDTIVGWLREEAANRGLPFLDAAGRVLVRRAIRNAKNIS